MDSEKFYELFDVAVRKTNFEAIRLFMSALDWTYFDSLEIPSRARLVEMVQSIGNSLYEAALEDNFTVECNIGSGGFSVKYVPDLEKITISFSYVQSAYTDELL